MMTYLFCIDCGKSKDTPHARNAPRCHLCENKRRAYPVNDGLKVCKTCKVEKSLTEFLSGKNSCKSCEVAKSLVWNRRNKATKNQNNKKSRLRHLEKARARDKRYSIEHKAQRLAYLRQWREKNQDRIKELKRSWLRANPEKKRVQSHRRRAHKLVVKNDLTHKQWQVILESYGSQCVYCGKAATEQEHIIPFSRGGENTQDNVVPACKKCNTAKGSKSLLAFMLYRVLNG